MFQVVDRTGQVHGPVSADVLRNWASEGRLTPDMTVINTTTGQQGPAGQLLAGANVFAAPTAQPYAPQPATPYSPPQSGAQGFVQSQIPQGSFAQPQQQYGFQGSEASGSIPKIGPRATAFLVDFLLGLGVGGSTIAFLSLVLADYAARSFNLGWTGYFNYISGPLVAFFFLFRDSFLTGQSVGKRIARIKVINAQGMPCNMFQSALRNLWAVPIFFLPIPYVGGFVMMPIFVLFFLVEIFMVLTTGKHVMDAVAKTLVVNE